MGYGTNSTRRDPRRWSWRRSPHPGAAVPTVSPGAKWLEQQNGMRRYLEFRGAGPSKRGYYHIGISKGIYYSMAYWGFNSWTDSTSNTLIKSPGLFSCLFQHLLACGSRPLNTSPLSRSLPPTSSNLYGRPRAPPSFVPTAPKDARIRREVGANPQALHDLQLLRREHPGEPQVVPAGLGERRVPEGLHRLIGKA